MSPDPQKSPLPFYNELPQDHVSHSPPSSDVVFLSTPSPSSPASEIRLYLQQVLQRRGLNFEQARDLASSWKCGTGRELRAYTVAMYREIFGAEGWVVYKDVKGRVYRDEKQELQRRRNGDGKGKGLTGWGKFFYSVLLMVMLAVMGGGIALLIFSNFTPFLTVPILMLIIGFGVSVLSIVKLSSGSREKLLDPEDQAEKELIEQWEKPIMAFK